MDVGLATAAIEQTRQTELRRLETDPQYDVYTARLIRREVDAALRNTQQAVMAAHESLIRGE